MSQIDYVLKFADKATAVADVVVVAQTYLDSQGVVQFFAHNCAIVTIWRNSQDTTAPGTDPIGNPITVITHHPLAGFFVLISLDYVAPALLNHAAVQLVVDRDKMNARQAGAVLKSGVTNAVLQDIRISPEFFGMNCPFGAFS